MKRNSSKNDSLREMSKTKNHFSQYVLDEKQKLKKYQDNRYITLDQFREKLKSKEDITHNFSHKKNLSVQNFGKTSATSFYPSVNQNLNTMNKTNAFSTFSINSNSISTLNFGTTISNFHTTEPNETEMNMLLTIYHKGHSNVSNKKESKNFKRNVYTK